MTEENIATPVADTSLPIVSLVDITDGVTVKDMNYEFRYDRIKQPNDNMSDLFNLNYREESMERWITCNGCLTQNFTVVKTEEVMRQIQEGLNSIITGERHYRSDTTVKATFLMSNLDLELPEDNAADKMIFKLITNVTADIDVLSRASLSFNIINGFSGNHALQLNYGFMKNIYGPEVEEGERKVITSNNPFLLDEYTHRLIHDQTMSVSFEEATAVQESVNNRITEFKEIPIVDAFVSDFVLKFPKKFTRKFLALFDDLPNEFKNMYYVSFIFGILIDIEKKIGLEIKLRKFIKSYIDEVNAANDATT
jgi:hypothetical protein